MSNPVKTNSMIARLEAANARAYERARADETLKSEQGAVHPPLDKQALPKQQSSRARSLFPAIVGLVLAASVYVMVFAWKSPYSDAARLIIARWAHAGGLQTTPQATSQDEAPPQPIISLEMERQNMADELRDLGQRIEQLKISQDLLKRSNADISEKFTMSSDQIARDNAKVVEQLNAILAQIAHHDAVVAEQLKATQEQVAELAWSRPAKLVRKPVRRRPVSILPSTQRLAQAQNRSR